MISQSSVWANVCLPKSATLYAIYKSEEIYLLFVTSRTYNLRGIQSSKNQKLTKGYYFLKIEGNLTTSATLTNSTAVVHNR